MKEDVKTLLTGGIASTLSNAAQAMQDTIDSLLDVPTLATGAEMVDDTAINPHVFVQFFIAAITFAKYLIDLRRARKQKQNEQ